ncbi:MAG TPA: hypothetical protein VKQ32_20940 [Polyangia bacterium]|nr:hypothetical protein [Polyangia bacterium]
MSRAYRLIAVWMAGALGTLAVYGAHRLERAESAAPAQPAPVALMSPRAAIVKYLEARYDEIEYHPDGYAVTGLAYIPAEAPLSEVSDARLRQFLPDTRFFITTVAAPNFEYREVRTLVSFRPSPRGDDIRTCLSASFRKLALKFFSQFIGVQAPTLQSRRELALAIAGLLAETMLDGQSHPSADLDAGGAEVWYGHWTPMHAFDVDVASDADGRVDRVIVSGAYRHDDDVIVSAWPRG